MSISFAGLKADPMKFLRSVLRANAAFSTLSGITMIVGGAAMGAWLGKPGTVAVDGAVLLGFAAAILWVTRRATVNLKAAAVIVALDLFYVADTARLIAGGQFTTAGNWFYGIAALVVLDFAVLQFTGIVRSAAKARAQASDRSATTGSTEAARRAGTTVDSKVTTTTEPTTIA